MCVCLSVGSYLLLCYKNLLYKLPTLFLIEIHFKRYIKYTTYTNDTLYEN